MAKAAKTTQKRLQPADDVQTGPAPATTDRERLIAEAAYFRAERRGFSIGDPLADWLDAEAEIDAMLKGKSKSAPTKQQQKELAAYLRLRENVKNILAETRDMVTATTLRKAIDEGSDELRKVGKYTVKTTGKVAEVLSKDMASAMQRMGPRWESFSTKSADLFDVWRDRSATFLSRAATASGRWLEEVGRKIEHQIYQSGEMTSGGTFECTACGTHIVLNQPGHLPKCGKCQQKEFRHL